MRFILLFSIIIGLFCFSACPDLRNSTAQSDVNNSAAIPKVDITPEKKPEESSPEITVFDLILSPYGKKQNKIYNEVEVFYGSAKIEKGAEFDILNEYGFLGKGKFVEYVKLTKDTIGYWKVEISKANVRPDIEKLSYTRMSEMEKEYPILPAYGVFPSKPERAKFKTSDGVDLSEKGISERQTVFMSLPQEIRDGADVYNKAEQNLEYPNRWMDLDGDGKIDFVYIRVRCEEEPYSHCGKYLYLQNEKWIELPEIE